MTTKETIKKLLVAYRKQCCVIGFLANQKGFNRETFDALLEARDETDEVINALCDELPDHIAGVGKKVREEAEPPPGVLAKPGKDGGIEWCWCNKCYGAADVVHDPFGDGNDWSYCKKCGVSFRLKRREEGK